MTKDKQRPKPLRVFTRQLRADLADEERRDMAIDLAGEQGRLEAARAEKEESTKTHAATIKRHEAEVGSLATAVNNGWVYRDVECHEYEDFGGKRIIHVRVDTGEEIFERPMNEDERQRPLIEA
jgi:hypothetical protein